MTIGELNDIVEKERNGEILGKYEVGTCHVLGKRLPCCTVRDQLIANTQEDHALCWNNQSNGCTYSSDIRDGKETFLERGCLQSRLLRGKKEKVCVFYEP